MCIRDSPTYAFIGRPTLESSAMVSNVSFGAVTFVRNLDRRQVARHRLERTGCSLSVQFCGREVMLGNLHNPNSKKRPWKSFEGKSEVMGNMIDSLLGISRPGHGSITAALESPQSIRAPSGSGAASSQSVCAPSGKGAGKTAADLKDRAWALGGDFNIGPAGMDLVSQWYMNKSGVCKQPLQQVSTGPIQRAKSYDSALVQGVLVFEVHSRIGCSFGGASDAHDMVIAYLTFAKDTAAKRKSREWPEARSMAKAGREDVRLPPPSPPPPPPPRAAGSTVEKEAPRACLLIRMNAEQQGPKSTGDLLDVDDDIEIKGQNADALELGGAAGSTVKK